MMGGFSFRKRITDGELGEEVPLRPEKLSFSVHLLLYSLLFCQLRN
jgi:hypothetical protein